MNNIFEFLPPQTGASKYDIGYPYYPANQDVYTGFEMIENKELTNPGRKPVASSKSEDNYAQFEYVTDENAEQDLFKPKKSGGSERADDMNEKAFEDDISGDDLDVPGSELDDEDEKVGSEDEENNYYSIGGDDHDDLEEDNG